MKKNIKIGIQLNKSSCLKKEQNLNLNNNIMRKKVRNQKSNSMSTDYQKTFLQRTEFLAREGKTAYIDEEFHHKISHIVFMLGESKMNISDYLHNVLKQHFKEHGDTIRELYNNTPKPNL